MPNWCYNNVIISKVSEEKRKEIINSALSGRLLNFLVPEPQDNTNTWYQWRISNWGTKWEAEIHSIYEEGEDLMITFETPWNPPLEALARGAEEHKFHFDITYEEEGCGLSGYRSN